MRKPKNNTTDNGNPEGLPEEISRLKEELDIQRRVAYAAGLFQGDITIRTLLESLAEGVVIIDSTSTIVLVNSQAEKMFGYQKDEIVGRPLNTLIPSRFHTAHHMHVQDYFTTPRIRPMGLGRELVARHKDGQEIHVEISLSHLETTNDKLAMAFIANISQRKEAEKALQSRNEELDAFAHTVAHDLKGSLTPLIGYSELLNQSDVELNDREIKDSLAEIFRVGQKMDKVIDALLLLASVRKEDVIVTPLEMPAIVGEAIARLSHECENYDAQIVLPDDFPVALGYAPWVEEVWYNLISNAIKYGGTPPKLHIGGELLENGFASFWVKDDGKGLTCTEQTQLFAPQRSSQSCANGHGLGLSIVKRIVEKLDGALDVKSHVDKGSIFSFSLPRAK